MTLEEIAADENTAQDFLDFVMNTPEPEDEKLDSVHVHLDEAATPELKSALGRMVELAKDWAARTFADEWDRKNAERQDAGKPPFISW